MYSSTTFEAAASYHQDELLREVHARKLAREVTGDNHTSAQHRLVAAALVVLMALAIVALI